MSEKVGLVLAFTCCFTCTYPYVRACATSKNKAFMVIPVPGLCF